MSSLAQFMSCNIGGTTFQLLEYTYTSEAVVKQGFGRIGTKITITGAGEIEADSLNTITARALAASENFSLSGFTIEIGGLNGELEQIIPAAACVDGGPHIHFQIGTGDSGSRRPLTFTAIGVTAPDGPIDTFTLTVSVKNDNLKIITRKGEIYGPNGVDAFNNALADFKATYAAPDYETRYESSITNDQYLTRVAYTMEAQELNSPLLGRAGSPAVSGSAGRRVERDESMRRTTTYDYDLLLDGQTTDAQAGDFIGYLRTRSMTDAGATSVFTETFRITSIEQCRVSASFVFIDGGNGNNLTTWQQSFEGVAEINPPLIGVEYIGASPIIVEGKAPIYRYTQRGTATGIGQYPQAPDPLYPKNQERAPKFQYQNLNDAEFQTTWEYAFIMVQALGIQTTPPLAALARPANPQFIAAPPPAIGVGAAGGIAGAGAGGGVAAGGAGDAGGNG